MFIYHNPDSLVQKISQIVSDLESRWWMTEGNLLHKLDRHGEKNRHFPVFLSKIGYDNNTSDLQLYHVFVNYVMDRVLCLIDNSNVSPLRLENGRYGRNLSTCSLVT